MAQDYSDAAALKFAKEAVMRLEAAYPGEPNKVLGKLVEMQSKNILSKVPSSEEIFKQRISELATAYAGASDGKGGVDRTNKRAAERFSLALEGKASYGPLPSQQLAIQTGRAEHLVGDFKLPQTAKERVIDFAEDTGRKIANNAGRFGLAGKAVGAAAALTVTFAATSGTASASELTEAGLNGVSNGLGTLTIGDASKGQNRLCKIFGDVVIPGAAGVGAGLVGSLATPAVGVGAGIAASTAASATLSEPATNACNKIAQKFGL